MSYRVSRSSSLPAVRPLPTDARVAVTPVFGRDGVAVPTYARGMRDNYEQRIWARIAGARHINDLDVSAETSMGV